MTKNKRGIRPLLIAGMTREQLINFIKRKDAAYNAADLAAHSDHKLRNVANELDQKTRPRKSRE